MRRMVLCRGFVVVCFVLCLSILICSNAYAVDTESNGDKQKYEEILARAKAGSAEDQYKLGCMYESGDTVDKNFQEAVKWYTLSVEQDYSPAEVNLGVLYEFGEGVEINYKVARELYEKAVAKK